MADFPGIPGFLPATGKSDTAFYNAVRDAPVDATVPEMIEQTRGLVEDFLNLNKGFATDAITVALATMDALKLAKLPPALPDPPVPPTLFTNFDAGLTLGFDDAIKVGDLHPEVIERFTTSPVTFPDITGELPTYTPLVTSLSIPDAPTLDLPPTPVAPGIDTTFALPDAPIDRSGVAPDVDPLTIPVYVPPVLPVFGDLAPEFNVLPPDPIIQWREPTYQSDIADAVKRVLTSLLAGNSTGIPPDVERAIWERARGREEVAALELIDAAFVQFSARGFSHPPGFLAGEVDALREKTELKLNELSRETAVDQANREQDNVKFAVQQGVAYEQVFTALFIQVVERNFQIAKFAVETQIQVYNLRVTAFNVEQQVFAQKTERYRVQLEAVFAYLKAFEALVNAERAKAEINTARVANYTAKVNAYATQVGAYRALIEGQVAKNELQKMKIDIFAKQIDAMVGLIGAQRAKFDAYTARVGGETAKAGLEEANARVFATRVQAIGTKAEIIFKQAETSIASQRLTLDWNIANMQRITETTRQQLEVIQAKFGAIDTQTRRSLGIFEAQRQSKQAELQANVSIAGLAIAKYQALLEQWKTRAQEVIQFGAIAAESLRAAGTMASNMVAGALAGTHVSAGISAGTSAGQNSSRSAASSSSQSKSVSESSGYNVNHNYNHRT